MDAGREKVEANRAYAQHIQGCSDGKLKNRAAKEAAEKDTELLVRGWGVAPPALLALP